MHTGVSYENLMERGHLEHPDIYGRIILKLIFNKQDLGRQNGLVWLGREKQLTIVNSVMNLWVP